MVDVVAAHKHSAHHREEIESSTQCGCFFCKSAFAPSEITKWVDDNQTAICPFCRVDSIIGDASGYPATEETFLQAMHKRWFWE